MITSRPKDAPASNEKQGLFRSGVAARLAGVPVNTLRVWERRYAVIGPKLSSGRQRLYSREDVRRLGLIKQLVDLGHPIGSLASLPDDTLAAVRETGLPARNEHRVGSVNAHRGPCRLALIGPLLAAQPWRQVLVTKGIDIVATCPESGGAVSALRGLALDLLIIEIPVLGEDNVREFEVLKSSTGAGAVAVLYRYAPTAIIRRLRALGYAVARAASDAAQIEAICRELLTPADSVERAPENSLSTMASGGAPSPLFKDRDLAFLSALPSKVACECPRHLVDLVVNLRSFELYSAQCVDQNLTDADLHNALQIAAGRARGVIEQALARLVDAEGISLPDGEVQS